MRSSKNSSRSSKDQRLSLNQRKNGVKAFKNAKITLKALSSTTKQSYWSLPKAGDSTQAPKIPGWPTIPNAFWIIWGKEFDEERTRSPREAFSEISLWCLWVVKRKNNNRKSRRPYVLASKDTRSTALPMNCPFSCFYYSYILPLNNTATFTGSFTYHFSVRVLQSALNGSSRFFFAGSFSSATTCPLWTSLALSLRSPFQIPHRSWRLWLVI